MAGALSGAFPVARSSHDASVPASRTNLGSDHLEFRGLSFKLPISSSSWRAHARQASSSRTEKVREEISRLYDAGGLVKNGLVFRQSFPIRSYDVGADQTCTVETIMNHLQETSLNHARVAGILSEGFGVTPEMRKRDLVWVVSKMHVLVEQYPSWGDVVEIDSWISSAGKNGMRRDWDIRDARSGRTISKATSTLVMINKHTRKLSRIAEEVRAEIEPLFFERDSIVEHDDRRIPQIDEETADHVLKGLTPEWTDIDCNQHVNNVKYIRWILLSIPPMIMESHRLVGFTLEYMRECRKDDVVRSLANISSGSDGSLEYCHVLCLHNGAKLIRARTTWKSTLACEPLNFSIPT